MSIQDEINDILSRLAAIEGTMTSADQVLALGKLHKSDIKAIKEAINLINRKIDALHKNVQSLNLNRHNKRYELKVETPVLVSGNTYELPTAYDPEALFRVDNPVVKVLESALTLASPESTGVTARRFESTVPLTADAKVTYFERIPALVRPVFA
jgi:hypothetical protein